VRDKGLTGNGEQWFVRMVMNKKKCMPIRLLDRLKCNKGFSLAEILVTALIFSVIMGAIHTTMVIGDSSWNLNSTNIALQQELRKAMDWMKDDLRQTGTAAVTNVPADGNWYTTITFQMVSGVSGGVITWNSDTTQFVLGGTPATQLQRIENSITKVLALDIQSLQFRRLASAPDVIEVALVAQKSSSKVGSASGVISSSLTFKVQMRN